MIQLAADLARAGVKVWREYIANIEEIYQLSDCYLFQVSSKTAAIELPLSVLEAMACNLPVITTRYGALGDLFSEGDGFLFAQDPEEMLERISLVREGISCRTREMVEPYTWANVLHNYWKGHLT
jgi:glycosyltransferase involved in cell wall biosynthesis